MSQQTFIFIHDQDLLLEFERNHKFSNLQGSVYYMFLGNRPVYKVINKSNVYVARMLTNNIEEHKYFSSYTGWYAVFHNNLIKADIVNLFEYDINYVANINEVIDAMIEGVDMIGYIPLFMRDYELYKNTKWSKEIIESIEKHYGIKIPELIEGELSNNPIKKWCATSNYTFTKPTFVEYMRWFAPIEQDLIELKNSGHAHERSITYFQLMCNKKIRKTKDIIEHFQLNSHGTQTHDNETNAIEKLIKSEPKI
jgi:hypothetical protein